MRLFRGSTMLRVPSRPGRSGALTDGNAPATRGLGAIGRVPLIGLVISAWLPLAALAGGFPASARLDLRSSFAAPPAFIDPAALRTLVLYNVDYPDENGDGTGDSEELALYYRAKRNIPPGLLLPLSCKASEGYSAAEWTRFFDEVVTPVRDFLARVGETRIDNIVVCYGVPITIDVGNQYGPRALDAALAAVWTIGTRDGPTMPWMWWRNPYLEESPSIPPDIGHFDHSYQIFNDEIYCVTRLEGDDVRWARELVDRALYGEKYIDPAPGAYNGYGYVDSRYGLYTDEELLAGYPFGYATYANADLSMAFGKFFVEDFGWDLKWEYAATEIGEPGAVFQDSTSGETAPSALWYEGWYNYNQYQDVWEWLVGAVACDLDSNSGAGIRRPQTTTTFLGQAFYRGLTAGAGVTSEPYLNGHYRPEVLLYYILRGYSFAEASFAANPTIGWRDYAIGDALYRPMRPKVPDIDTIPPPVPLVIDFPPAGGGDTARTIRISIETIPERPDLVVSRIDWGLDPGFGQVADYGAIYHMEEDRTLTGLMPATTYDYRVTLMDPAGNRTESAMFSFTTDP